MRAWTQTLRALISINFSLREIATVIGLTSQFGAMSPTIEIKLMSRWFGGPTRGGGLAAKIDFFGGIFITEDFRAIDCWILGRYCLSVKTTHLVRNKYQGFVSASRRGGK